MAAAPPLPDIFTEDVTFPQTPSFQQEIYFETQTCEDRSPASHVQRDLTFTLTRRVCAVTGSDVLLRFDQCSFTHSEDGRERNRKGRGSRHVGSQKPETHTHTSQVFLPFVASSASAFFGLF